MTQAHAARIEAYAREKARKIISVRRVDPVHAAELEAEAQAEAARMRREAGLADLSAAVA